MAPPKFKKKMIQKPVVQDLTPMDALMKDIQKRAVSDDHVFDGNNKEITNNNIENVYKYESTPKAKAVSAPDSHDILLSQIKGGIKLKALPE